MKQYYILGMIILIVLMLWVGSEVLKASTVQKTEEGFTMVSSGITLNFCPLWAPQVQTAKGNTDCCEGQLLDGKCNSRTFCTLSPTHDNVPSCIHAWKQYFVEKSKQCPSTMANYYEDVKTTGGRKGCSASAIKEDGSTPVSMSAKRCVIYATEKENREKADSCFVEKERLKVQCPPFAGYRSNVDIVMDRQNFGSYVCVYSNQLGQRNSCNDEKSLIAMWDRQNPNWRLDKNKYAQMEAISCRTFLDRERKKEQERQRIEAERRKAELERQRAEAERKRADVEKKKAEEERKKREAERKRYETIIQQLRNRFRRR